MRIWIKRVLIGLCVSSVVVAGAVGTLLFMPIGLTFALWGVHSILPQLTIQSAEGSFINGFTLKGISYQSADVSFKGKMLSIEFNKGCFLKSMVCVNALNVDGVDLQVAQIASSEDKTKDPASPPISDISFPIPVFLNNISLNDISLDILANKVHWNVLKTGIELQGDQLTLKPTLLEGIDFKLANTQKETKKESTQKGMHPQTSLVLPDVNVPLNIVVEHFELNNAKLELPEKQVIEKLIIEGKVSGSQVELNTLVLDVNQGKITASGEATLKDKYPLQLNAHADIKLAPLNGHSVSLNAKGDLGALLLDVKMKGTLQADVQASLNALDPSLPFNAILTSSHLQWPIDSAQKYRLSSTQLKVSGSLDVYRATLKTAFMGEGIPAGVLHTQLNGDLSHISLNELNIETLDGKIQGTGNVNWKEEVKWDTRIKIEKIKPGLQWSQLNGGVLSGLIETKGRVNHKGGWIVKLPSFDIYGKYRKKSFSLVGEMGAADLEGKGNIRVETKAISFHHGQNTIELSGKVGRQLELDLILDVPNLTDFSSKIKGQVKGKIDIWGTIKAPNASFNLDANSIDVEKLVSIKKMNLRGSVKSTPLISGGLLLKMQGLKSQGVDISALSLRASGDEKDHTLSLEVEGEPVSANINLRGGFKANKNWEGQLYASHVDTPIGPWKLDKNVNVAFNSKTKMVNVGVFCWLQKKSRLCLDKSAVISDSGQADVSLSHFNLLQLQTLLPQGLYLNGVVNGKAKVAWKPKSLPNIDAHVMLEKGSITPQKGKPLTLGWDEILLNVKLENENLNAKVKIDLTDNGRLNFNAKMTDLSSNERTLKSDLDIRDINIDVLSSLVGPGAIVEGMINSRISLENKIKDGNIDIPQAKGSISLTKLKLQSLALPIEVNKGEITLQLKGSEGEIKGELKTEEGDVLLLGNAHWSELDKMRASFSVKGKDIKVIVPPMVTLKVSPNINLKLTPKELNVTGKVDVPWGRIVVESLPVSAVKISNDVVILNDKFEPIKKEKPDLLIVNAQIGVTIGDDVKLDAFGLKSGLVGILNVESDQYGQKVGGEINLEKGTFRSFGQDLLIKKGQIIFNGPPDQPYIQIEAIRNPDAIEDDVEAGIRLSGPADSPEMEIFSKPAMAQANALSYLTRGRNLDSTSDGNVMTSMLIGLGLSQSQKLVGQIGDAVGVDDFSLDTSGTGNDEKVEVSGYILPGLQVKYGVGIFTRLPEFKVRYRLIKDLYVEAVSGTDNAIDLLYQFTVK